jgi:hypothetical protein
MARILLVCLVLLAAALPLPARADDAIFRDFDPAAFGASERRLLQTALAATGDYSGPLDGDWGPASAAALAAYAAREFGAPPLDAHAAALVLGFMDEVEASGWDFRYLPELGVSLALPLARLGGAEPEEGGERRWSEDGRLSVLFHRFDADEARRWHAAAVRAGADTAALVTERGADRLLTAGLLRDGRSFLTRSDLAGGGWATVLVVGEPGEAAALNLVAASIRPGRPLPWDLPPNGRLSELVRAIGASPGGAGSGAGAWSADLPGSPRAAAPSAGFDGTSTGTGFYLGADTLVTAAHVVAGCASVTLAGGRALEVVAADADLDVAALRDPGRGGRWLALAEGELRLGQQVLAAGFPYYAIAGTSLSLTGGNVSALAGVDDDRRFFTFSAPVQPGNSGGPLIDSRGAVRGLVVARLSEDFIVEATGSLPQNVNYALGEAELVRFLGRHGIGTDAGGLGGFDIADGAPAEFGEAVVPILCH